MLSHRTPLRLFAVCALCLLFALPLSAKRPAGVRVCLETDAGKITLRLYDDTPLHRDNFIRLIRDGFFDGTIFHRVIRDFMIQGGDPTSGKAPRGAKAGEHDAGYTVPAEIRVPAHYHKRGALAAARKSDDENPKFESSGSQFYIVWGAKFKENDLREKREQQRKRGMDVPLTPEMLYDYTHKGGTPHLDGGYTVFGEVEKGLKVIGKIQKMRTDTNDRPIDDVHIIRAYILE